MEVDDNMKENCKCFCPSIFASGGIVTAMIFGFWCRSWQFSGNTVTLPGTHLGNVLPPIILPPNIDNVTFDMPDLHMAPWYRTKTNVNSVGITNDGSSYQVTVYSYNTCVEWGSDEDTKWRFTKAATVITVTLGGLLGALVCFTPCMYEIVAKLWYCIALTYILVLALFQGLTFLIFQSNACEENPIQRELRNDIQNAIDDAGINYTLPDSTNLTGVFWKDECDWDSGSSANVAAAIFWFLAGVSMLLLGAPTGEDGEGSPEPNGKEKKEQAKEEEEGDIEVDAE